MIQISTSFNGRRHILLPQTLVDVAHELFAENDLDSAVFCLARSLTVHDLHTVENIALNVGHAEAVAFAQQRQVARPWQKRQDSAALRSAVGKTVRSTMPKPPRQPRLVWSAPASINDMPFASNSNDSA